MIYSHLCDFVLQSARVLELQSELDAKLGELTHAHERLTQSDAACERLRDANDAYIKQLEELSGVTSFRDEQFRGQLHTQEKLINLYKVSQ